jgi:hypothetical protein
MAMELPAVLRLHCLVAQHYYSSPAVLDPRRHFVREDD